ncbi:MAG: hypothetical protein ABI670_22800 [Chloroflexota bacterium]
MNQATASVRRVSRFVILLPVLALLLSACGRQVPAGTQDPVIYPGAANVTEQKLEAADSTLNIYKAVSFTTTDGAPAVLQFYQDSLLKEEWELDTFQPDPNEFVFKWSTYDRPPATYMIEVAAHEQADGKTGVRIRLRYNPGEGQ